MKCQWLGCSAHKLQLVADGLKEIRHYDRLCNAIQNCKSIARFDKRSSKFSQKLHRRMKQATEVRWNSICMMIILVVKDIVINDALIETGSQQFCLLPQELKLFGTIDNNFKSFPRGSRCA